MPMATGQHLIVRGPAGSGARNVQPQLEFFEEQPAARLVGLKPLAVDDQLRNGALAYMAHDFGGGGRIAVHINLGVDNAVRVEELLGGTAVAAPGSGINLNLHGDSLARRRCYHL